MKGSNSITVVMTAHREGLLAVATLKSLERAVLAALKEDWTVDVVVSLDSADDLTKDVFRSCGSLNLRLLEHESADPARARNLCVQEAKGNYIAILDADDLVSSNWLSKAMTSALADPRQIVWHPEVNVIFGEDAHIFRHIDMETDEFDAFSVIAVNPWTSLCFARRQIFLEIPYPACDFSNGIGHEDWGWNRRIIERGYIHKVVIGTGHAIRRKPVSVVKRAVAANAIPVPTKMFRQALCDQVTIKNDSNQLRSWSPD